MFGSASPRAVLLALVLLSAIGGAARGEVYRDPEHHYTVTFPPGCEVMPPQVVGQVNAMVRQRMPGSKIRYETGFQRKGAAALQVPYVLVQFAQGPSRNASYEDIEKAFANEYQTGVKKAEAAFGDVAKNFAVNTPVLDRANNRVVIRLELEGMGVGKIQGLSVGFLGSKDIVFIHSYAAATEFDQELPVFQKMLESFQFDSGYAFTPGTGSSFLSNAAGSAAIGGLAGGIAGALVAVPYFIWKRFRKPQDSPPDPDRFAVRKG